jgi:hypothetical protein
MKIKELLNDYSIHFKESGKNIQDGWIGLNCPFCPDPSTHLGYNLSEEFGTSFNCWRCGSHSAVKTISALLDVNERRAREIIRSYEGKSETTEPEIEVHKKELRFPSNVDNLKPIHKWYLKKRGFSPKVIENYWGVMGTGPTSILDDKDYRYRIVIPIYWNGKVVSWQTRDVTGKGEPKYINCPKDREIIHNKSIVYGLQEYWGDTGIVTEGVTDVWRLGPMAVATLGISFKDEQVRVIARHFKNICVIFDSGKQAQYQADRMVKELFSFYGKNAWKLTVDDDPANLSQEEANYLVKQILGRNR